MHPQDLYLKKTPKLFIRMNLYDSLAYFLVGISAMLLTYGNLYLLNHAYKLPTLTWSTTLPWTVVLYFLGTTVQEIARLVFKHILRFRNRYSDNDIVLLNMMGKHFGLRRCTWDEIYKVGYLYVRTRDISGLVDLFHALYALYRGWMVLLCAESIFIVVYFFALPFPILYLGLSASLATLFFIRSRYFFSLIKEKVFHTFVVLENSRQYETRTNSQQGKDPVVSTRDPSVILASG